MVARQKHSWNECMSKLSELAQENNALTCRKTRWALEHRKAIGVNGHERSCRIVDSRKYTRNERMSELAQENNALTCRKTRWALEHRKDIGVNDHERSCRIVDGRKYTRNERMSKLSELAQENNALTFRKTWWALEHRKAIGVNGHERSCWVVASQECSQKCSQNERMSKMSELAEKHCALTSKSWHERLGISRWLA